MCSSDLLLRTFSFVVTASALWALLPLVAKYQLSEGAQVYGYLLGSLGLGAVAGAVLTPLLLEYFSVNLQVLAAIVVFSLVTGSLSLIDSTLVMCAILFFAGMSWQLVGNFNLTSMQTAVPSWVRGRSLSVYMLVFQGAMALGGFFWGSVAEEWGVPTALFGAACALALAFLVALALPARMGDSSEISTATRRPDPDCPVELDEAAGPLVVETEYSIRPEDREAFLALIRTASRARLRDGARSWLISAVDGDGEKYLHQLEVASWRNYQRVLARMTVRDESDEEALDAFHTGGGPPSRRYFIRG